jgi:hypothetical protein
MHDETTLTISMRFTRREALRASVGGGLALAGFGRTFATTKTELPPVRTITRGPKFHWFGYYDKFEFDLTNRYVLGMEVDFEHRSPTPQDSISIGMVDLQDHDRWIDLGRSSAWCWQQGCMLQWVPGSQSDIMWNDRDSDHFCCHVMDVHTGQRRTIPHPIYTLSPDGKTGLSLDFSRLHDVRPGYGYAGVPDPNADQLVPRNTGIFRVDMQTGQQELIVSLGDIAARGARRPSMEGAKHKFNHLLFNQDASRFIFLHRWTGPKGRETRMYTSTPEGKDVRLLDDNGITSHFMWRDSQHILALSNQRTHGMRFYLFEDGGKGAIEVVGEKAMTSDGHCSYLPNKDWILNDTYPQAGFQHVFLYHVPTERQIFLGHFRAPPQYEGEWRCDTHPRYSRDGRMVVIDAPEPSTGRQLHLIDISEIVG